VGGDVKLVAHFASFLNTEVNLNQSRIELLQGRVDAITNFVCSTSPFNDREIRIVRQGSWQHRTIIKPPGNNEFDADLALFMEPIDDWSPSDYIDNLYSAFRSHGTYRDMDSRKSRCLTVDYSGDFHLDIAPIVARGILSPSYYAQNRRLNEEEETNPEGYSEWFSEKNQHTCNNMLIKVTKLTKYLRDIKKTFSIRSIILSTLLGNQINDGWLGDDADESFPDVSTSLVTIFRRLDDFLQEYEIPPEIRNPALYEEAFAKDWNEDEYVNFRNRINIYRKWIDEAFEEDDREASITKWRRVFGEGFARSVTLRTRALTASSSPLVRHEQEPIWQVRISEQVELKEVISDKQSGEVKGELENRGTLVRKQFSLKFEARTTALPPFKVHWQVVNTGNEAAAANNLRGEIERSDGGLFHSENTKYSGRHWIRCYVVKDNVCIAQSDRFVVLIQ